jgi:hypothetical protein
LPETCRWNCAIASCFVRCRVQPVTIARPRPRTASGRRGCRNARRRSDPRARSASTGVANAPGWRGWSAGRRNCWGRKACTDRCRRAGCCWAAAAAPRCRCAPHSKSHPVVLPGGRQRARPVERLSRLYTDERSADHAGRCAFGLQPGPPCSITSGTPSRAASRGFALSALKSGRVFSCQGHLARLC